MKIVNHRLQGDDIAFVDSPNKGGKLLADTLVYHFTAGGSADSAIRWLSDPRSKASAHVILDFDGSLTQLVPFDTIAWHAGKSAHLNRVGLNKFSIGIEIVNAGRLVKSGDSYTSWFGKRYSADEVFFGVHRNETEPSYWHQYTEAQIVTAEEVGALLVDQYELKYVLGHEEISPGRKIDPGPAFPLGKIRQRLLNIDPRSGEEEKITSGAVSANRLNIRSGPSRSKRTVSDALVKGQAVEVLEESDGWYRVRTALEGWVSSDFIERG